MKEQELALVRKVGDVAFQNEMTYGGCAQAVVGAFREVLGEDVVNEGVFKSASGLCGGCANTGNVCGAVSGGVLVLSLFVGRDLDTWESGSNFPSYDLGQRLMNRFKESFWSINCRDVQERLMGRYFNTNYEDELQGFMDAGGHTEHCPKVTRAAAEKVMEILLEEGLVDDAGRV